MNKIEIINSNLEDGDSFPMSRLEPLQIAKITGESSYKGDIVMRTASYLNFEVMNLSNPKAGACWGKKCDLQVKPLPNAKIKVII